MTMCLFFVYSKCSVFHDFIPSNLKALDLFFPSGWQGEREPTLCVSSQYKAPDQGGYLLDLTNHSKTLCKITWSSAMDTSVHDIAI